MVITPFSSALIAAATISSLVAVLAWFRRGAPGAVTLALLMTSIAIWSAAFGLEAMRLDVNTRILWSKLEFAGANATPVLLLLVALEFAQEDRWLTRGRIGLLWLLPSINVAVTATNEWHSLMWTGFSWGPAGTNLLIYHHGPWYYVVTASMYAYVAVATMAFARTSLQPPAIHQQQARILLIASIAPWISGALYLLDLNPLPGFDLVPVSFALTGLVIAWAILDHQVLDLTSIARHTQIASMSDGVLVLDARNRLVDKNPAADRLLRLSASSVGTPGSRILERWPAAAASGEMSCELAMDLLIDAKAGTYADLQISSVSDRHGRPIGRLIVLHDITARKRAESALQTANARLTARLAKIVWR